MGVESDVCTEAAAAAVAGAGPATLQQWPEPQSLDDLVTLLRAELGEDGLDTLDEKRLAKITFLLSSYQVWASFA